MNGGKDVKIGHDKRPVSVIPSDEQPLYNIANGELLTDEFGNPNVEQSQYQAAYLINTVNVEGVELDIREDALVEIAKKAIERKTGARGLRSILEKILMETMYKIPSENSLLKVVVDAAVVVEENEPLMVYDKEKERKRG